MEKFYALRNGKLAPFNISKFKYPAIIFGVIIFISLSLNIFSLLSVLFPDSDTRQLKIENYKLKIPRAQFFYYESNLSRNW